MSYENPVTYVDTESSKILANTIAGVGQMTAKIITDDIKKRAAIAKENKIKNEKKQQSYKKYQLEGQSNVNILTKDLDFGSNESFRGATSGIVDRLAKAKSDYEFATDPDEIKKLSQEINQLDTFLTKTFGGEMDDLAADIEEMRNLFTNPGVEGGLDLEQDSDYTTFLTAMAQGDEPGDMSFTMDPETQDIVLTVKGDQYANGEYTISLRGNQSTEIGRIPVVDMRTSKQNQPSALQNIGVIDENNSIPPKYFSSEEGDSQNLANNVTIFQYKINEEGEKLVKDAVIAEAAGLLKGGEGLAGGIKATNAYYRNILLKGDNEKSGETKGIPAFLEPGQHEVTDSKGNVLYTVPVTEESWNILVDRMTEREVSFVNSKMATQTRATVSAPTGGNGTEKEREEQDSLSSFSSEESVSIASGSSGLDIYNQIKNNPSSYDYDPGEGFTATVRNEKDYKDGLTKLTVQELHDQGILKFDESELNRPDSAKAKEKVNNFLATLGDDENKFVNYNDGSSMEEKEALVALYKSTPKYANLKPSQIEDLVNNAMKKRAPKENEDFSEDVSRFQTDNVEDVENGEFSEEYASATEEISGYSSPLFSRFRPDEVAKRKKERSKLVTKQKKDRKLLEEKYPNVIWPWKNN